jgi:transcription elongation factor GreA
MNKEPMTSTGFASLEEELKQLRTVERLAVARALSEARDMGDISENAEYHAAKERQSFVEARMAQIGEKLRQAEIIDVAKLSGKEVKFGATVRLSDEDTGERHTYQIVGVDEADIKSGRVSVTAPIARSLIGRKKGESFEVTTPRGSKSYKIITVKYV